MLAIVQQIVFWALLLLVVGFPVFAFVYSVVVPTMMARRYDVELSRHPLEEADAGRFEVHIVNASHVWGVRDSKTGIFYPDYTWPRMLRPLDEKTLHKVVVIKDHCVNADKCPRRWYLSKAPGHDPELSTDHHEEHVNYLDKYPGY